MLINFPNQLTNEEEQLLKKIAKMKKKKKTYLEKKAARDAALNEAQAAAAASTSAALKRTNSGSTVGGKQIDAKEVAKKLVQSGVIKLETENKEKGFKRSCSRKDDIKKSTNDFDSPGGEKQISYSSVSSINSPLSAGGSPFGGGHNRFTFDSAHHHQKSNNNNYSTNNYSSSSSSSSPFGGGPQQRNYRNSFNNQGGAGTPTGGRNFNNNNKQQQQQSPSMNQQQQNGISLFIKANNVNEELLRSLFGANVANAKILSIEIKTNYAFVHVDSKEAADNAISELNGKVFNESMFSVSYARPRKTFNRNVSYDRPPPSLPPSAAATTPNPHFQASIPPQQPQTPLPPPQSENNNSNNQSESGRSIINYEDI